MERSRKKDLWSHLGIELETFCTEGRALTKWANSSSSNLGFVNIIKIHLIISYNLMAKHASWMSSSHVIWLKAWLEPISLFCFLPSAMVIFMKETGLTIYVKDTE